MCGYQVSLWMIISIMDFMDIYYYYLHKPANLGKHRQNILLINLNHRNDIVKEYLNKEEDK